MQPYYEDSAVTLFLGDCLEVLPQLEPVEHVITDPPYARDVYVRAARVPAEGAGTRPGRTDRGIHNLDSGALARMAAGDIGAIDDILESIAGHLARLVNRWALVFSDVESCSRWRTALELSGMRYVRTGAWLKPDAMPQMSGDRPAVGFEPCTIAHAQGPMRWNGGGRQAAWTYNTVKGPQRPDHPCPKPEPLMGELVALFTDEGDVILDLFAGSGTTGVAAKRLGRRAILIEKEERYCEVAARRLSQGALDMWEPAVTVDAVRQSLDLQPDDPAR